MEPTERLPSYLGRMLHLGKTRRPVLLNPWVQGESEADLKAVTTPWKKCGVNRERWSQQFGTVRRSGNRYTGLQWDAIHLRPYIYVVNSPDVSRQVCLSSGLDRGPRDSVCVSISVGTRFSELSVKSSLLFVPFYVLWLFGVWYCNECVYCVSTRCRIVYILIYRIVFERWWVGTIFEYQFCNFNWLNQMLSLRGRWL